MHPLARPRGDDIGRESTLAEVGVLLLHLFYELELALVARPQVLLIPLLKENTFHQREHT